MTSNASGQSEGHEALSDVDAAFERVRQLTLDSAEAWLVATNATVTQDAHYDATFLFLTHCYHSEVRVTFSRGHRLFDAVLRWRISQFQIVQGPVVREWSDERAAADHEEDDDE